jgi:hypothetical protein
MMSVGVEVFHRPGVVGPKSPPLGALVPVAVAVVVAVAVAVSVASGV